MKKLLLLTGLLAGSLYAADDQAEKAQQQLLDSFLDLKIGPISSRTLCSITNENHLDFCCDIYRTGAEQGPDEALALLHAIQNQDVTTYTQLIYPPTKEHKESVAKIAAFCAQHSIPLITKETFETALQNRITQDEQKIRNSWHFQTGYEEGIKQGVDACLTDHPQAQEPANSDPMQHLMNLSPDSLALFILLMQLNTPR